jgi:AcrR family transcriptional regulator
MGININKTYSLREAARTVGVSANAAYRHFDDKSVLMAAVAADGFAQLAKRMRRAMDATTVDRSDEPDAVARFKAVGRAYVEFASDHPPIFRVMFGEGMASCAKPVSETLDAESPWDLLGLTLDALVVDGVLDPARRPGAEWKAWAAVHGHASLLLEGVPQLTTTPVRHASLEALLQFAVVGICGDPRTEADVQRSCTTTSPKTPV